MLKSTGIVRMIDNNGRVTLPLSVRRDSGLRANTSVEFFVDEETHEITLKAFSMDMDSKTIIDQFWKMVYRTAGTASAGELTQTLREMMEELQYPTED